MKGNTGLAIVLVGADLAVRHYTPAAAAVLGLRAADVGHPIRRLVLGGAGDLGKLVATSIETLHSSDHAVRDENGRWYSLRLSPCVTPNNRLDGAVVALELVDLPVQQSRLSAEHLLATVRHPLIVLDGLVRIVTANPAFCRAFGVEPGQLVGRPLYEVDAGRWDLPIVRRLLDQTAAADDPDAGPEVVQDEPGGGRKVWRLAVRPVVPSEPGAPLTLLAMEDVSELRTEAQLRRQTLAELAEVHRRRDESVALLAHELRHPLAAIGLAAQVLGEPRARAADIERARVLLERQIRNMTRLIDDLFDVARITQGAIDLHLAPVDVATLLVSAAELVRRDVAQYQQDLSVALPPASTVVLGDAARLEQVFGNLLHNASKFTPRGGHLWVTVDSPPDATARPGVVVRVGDDGIGIPAEALPHVFEAFRQASPSPHLATGLGIGLALVRRIVELHGGDVTVSSGGTGKGSEFVVYLPTADRSDSPGLQASDART